MSLQRKCGFLALKENHTTFVMLIVKSNVGNVPLHEVRCDGAVSFFCMEKRSKFTLS